MHQIIQAIRAPRKSNFQNQENLISTSNILQLLPNLITAWHFLILFQLLPSHLSQIISVLINKLVPCGLPSSNTFKIQDHLLIARLNTSPPHSTITTVCNHSTTLSPRILTKHRDKIRSLAIVDLIWYSAGDKAGLPEVAFVSTEKFLRIYITLAQFMR